MSIDIGYGAYSKSPAGKVLKGAVIKGSESPGFSHIYARLLVGCRVLSPDLYTSLKYLLAIHYMSARSDIRTVWGYPDVPFLYICDDPDEDGARTTLGGCTQSCYTGEILASRSGQDARTTFRALLHPEQKRDIPEIFIQNLYEKTIEGLSDPVWSQIEAKDPAGFATFASEFRVNTEQYVNTRVMPTFVPPTKRTKRLNFLTGSKKFPLSAPGSAVPAWTGVDAGSKPEVGIYRKGATSGPITMDRVIVRLPCTVVTAGTRSSALLRRSGNSNDVPVALTGTQSWWKDSIVAKSDVLASACENELQKLEAGVSTEAQAKLKIGEMYDNLLRRQIMYCTSTARDLDKQLSDHKSFSETTGHRLRSIPGEPFVQLTMRPMGSRSDLHQDELNIHVVDSVLSVG